jgi:hypothetical protein
MQNQRRFNPRQVGAVVSRFSCFALTQIKKLWFLWSPRNPSLHVSKKNEFGKHKTEQV